MPATKNITTQISRLVIMNPAAQGTTLTSAAADTLNYDGLAAIVVSVGAVSGTNPTLDIKVQSSATSGGTYVDVPGSGYTTTAGVLGIPTITAANQVVSAILDLDSAQRFIKLVCTIGGTGSPNFLFGAHLAGFLKYV